MQLKELPHGDEGDCLDITGMLYMLVLDDT